MSPQISNSIQLDPASLIRPKVGMVRLRSGAWFIEVEPLLTFESRSPDRFWTIFAPTKHRIGPACEAENQSVSADFAHVEYRDGPHGVLEVSRKREGTTEITAWSQLGEAVFSHLNTFCRFTVSGFDDPAVAFSPCSDMRIQITEAQYPIGKPMRLAFYGTDAAVLSG